MTKNEFKIRYEELREKLSIANIDSFNGKNYWDINKIKNEINDLINEYLYGRRIK